MLINGEAFKIYELDTIESIVTRIAAILDTTPDWLIFEPPLNQIYPSDTAYSVSNVLTDIANQDDLRFPRSVRLPEKISSDVAQRVFVATNGALKSLSKRNAIDTLLAVGELDIDVRSAIDDRDKIADRLKRSIAETKRRYNSFMQKLKAFDAAPFVAYSAHELAHVQFTLLFEDVDYDITEMYNFVTLSDRVPFAFYISPTDKTIYKIYKKFRIYSDWLDFSVKNVILMKVNAHRANKISNEWYTNAAFTKVTIDGKSTFVGTFDLKIGPKYIDKQTLVDFVMDTFSSSSSDKSRRSVVRDIVPRYEDNVNVSYFAFPNQCLDIDVFSELAMNDETFTSTIAIDEFVKAYKTKQNLYLHVLNSTETCSLQMKSTDRYNEYGMSTVGTRYIKCRLRTASADRIEPCQRLIGKLLYIYNAKRLSVIARYRRYIPNFLTVDVCKKKITATDGDADDRSHLNLRNIAPEIFASKYSRKCIYRPSIVDDAEATTTDLQVMRFPTKGETIERNYVCKLPDHPYPGLRANTLENKRAFPYVPCCYSKDQRERTGSLYRKYFLDEDVGGDVKHIQHVYTTNKILPPNIIGSLPIRLVKMFTALTVDAAIQYVRKGVERSALSVIECILMAKGKLPIDRAAIRRLLASERRRLTNEECAMAAKQELYDYSTNQIEEMLEKSDIRPSRFIRTLELVYDCNIFLFGPGPSYEGQLMIPDHAKAYYKFKPTRDTIFLYEHLGSESDVADYPQCELIVKTSIDDVHKQTTSFSPSDPLVVDTFELFRRLTSAYMNGHLLMPVTMRKMPIADQLIDAYGKCRVINVVHDSVTITICTDPIPPFMANRMTTVYRVTTATVSAFCSRWRFDVMWQRTYDRKIKEIGIYFGIVAVVLIDDVYDNAIVGVPIRSDEQEYADVERNVDRMLAFESDRRIAKILYRYGQYALSNFMYDKSLIRLTDKDFDTFSRTVTIDKNRSYEHRYLNPKFRSDTDFYKDGTLSVDSRETLVRLLFMLRLYYRYHYDDLVKFRTLTYIPNFYEDIDDFDTNFNQYVIDGKQTALNLIDSYSYNYRLWSIVKPDNKVTYFFKNNLVGSDIYLAKNVSSLRDANRVYQKWKRDGYVSKDDAAADDNDDDSSSSSSSSSSSLLHLSLYKYVDERDIALLERTTSDGICLAYLSENVPAYTVLLKI